VAGAGAGGTTEVGGASAGGKRRSRSGVVGDLLLPALTQSRAGERVWEGDGRQGCLDEGGSHSLVVGMKERFKRIWAQKIRI
jgi:hypothetical protein